MFKTERKGSGKPKPRPKLSQKTKANSLPVWTSTSFSTPVGRAVKFRELVVRTATERKSRYRCVLDEQDDSAKYGTARKWAQVVEWYLEAERTGVPVQDDLSSRVRIDTVSAKDARVSLRGQRCVRAQHDLSLRDDLKCMGFDFWAFPRLFDFFQRANCRSGGAVCGLRLLRKRNFHALCEGNSRCGRLFVGAGKA
jgi:hypothetical protein